MKKCKVVIAIFPMIKEIDYLERTLILLKQNSMHIDRDKFSLILDISLPTSDYLVDWDKSIIKKDYFINRLKNFERYYLDWCDECFIRTDDSVYGCLDYIVNTFDRYIDNDAIIILEPDVVFGPLTLSIYLESLLKIKQVSNEFIITAEYAKIWDSSWDIIVNKQFINEPFNYRDTNDVFSDTYDLKNNGEISIKPLLLDGQKWFKFGGGWFTLYSKSLIDSIKFPKELKGYGPFDNYVMEYCFMNINKVTQYKIENLVISDKNNQTSHYDNYIYSIDRKHDLYETNNEIMKKHFINKFGQL